MSIKCNMPPEQRDKIWDGYSDYLTTDEEEKVGRLFRGHIFYRSDGKKTRHCFCDKCNEYFSIHKGEDPASLFLSHGSAAHCPHCGESVELVAEGKIQSGKSLEEKISVVVIRTDKQGGVLLIAGVAMKEYYREDWYQLRPYLSFTPTKRYYFNKGVRQCWKKSYWWVCGKPCQEFQWTVEKNILSAFSHAPTYYDTTYDGFYNVVNPEKLEDSFAKYSRVADYIVGREFFVESDRCQGMERYLGCYAEFPQLEFAVKMGETDVVNDLVWRGVKNHRIVDWKADNLPGFYRMTKQQYKEFLRKGGTLDNLRFAKNLKKDIWEVLKIRDFFGNGTASSIEKFYRNAERANSTAENSLKYLRRQKRPPKEAFQLWQDYLDMAGQLGFDLTNPEISMPMNLQTSHDRAASMLKIQTNAQMAKTYRKRKNALKKRYEMEYGGMCIRVPERASDIAEEGEALHHCVAGYANRHINGKTTILFLRKADKPEESLVTIEMMGDGITIKQIHGWCNEGRPKDGVWLGNPREVYKEFLTVWLEWIKAGSKRTSTGEPMLNIRKENKTA